MIPILILLFGLALIGLPIAVALGLTAAAFVAGSDVPFNIFPLVMIGSLENFVLLALPLFMIAGEAANRAGIAEQLIELVSSLFGWMRGGLAQCATAGGMVFAEISGSSVADVASLTTILAPVMESRGYPRAFAAANTAASAAIAIIIPPSIPLILYGALAEQSVAKMFVAGVVPGLVLGGAVMLFNYGFARRHGWAPEGPFEWRRVLRAVRHGAWGLTLPLLILGGILGGFFTPTEAGAFAVLLTFFIGLTVTRRIAIADIAGIILVAAKRTGAVLLMISTASVFGWFLTDQGIPQAAARWLMALSDNRNVVMFGLNVALLLLGTFLHGAAAIMLIVPLALPIIERIGYDPVHFGIILALNMAIGQQIPPSGAVIMTATTISGARIRDVMRYTRWYMLCMFLVLQLVTYVPALSLWLPAHLIGQ
jgi:C4-dicarboxylate transporter, DctM subunit